MRFDQPGERARERPRPALGHAPAPALTAMDQRICKPSRHRPFRRDHGLERHPQHERAAMIVLEIVADDIPTRHRNAAQPFLAVGMFGEALVDRLAPTDRRVGDGVEDRLDRVVVGDHAPVRGGILPGELGELVARSVDVVVLRQIGAVRERNVHHDLGMNVFQSVVAEPELVVAQHRAILDHDMGRSARVVLEARKRQLLRDAIAAHDRPALQHQTAIARLGEIGGGDQAVVPGTRDDDIEPIRHVHSHYSNATQPSFQMSAPPAAEPMTRDRRNMILGAGSGSEQPALRAFPRASNC